MSVALIDLILQIGTLLLGGGLGAAVLSYVRNRRKDSLDAYTSLYDRLAARNIQLENEIEAERQHRRALELRVAELEALVARLEVERTKL